MQRAEQAVRALTKADPAWEPFTQVADGDLVPGHLVFRMKISPPEESSGFAVGLVSRDDVVLKTEPAMDRAVTAWGYGPERTVSAAVVAKVVAYLHSGSHSVNALLDMETVAGVRKDYRKRLFAPREKTVASLPAVEFWARSSNPPFLRMVVVFEGRGKWRVESHRIDVQ